MSVRIETDSIIVFVFFPEKIKRSISRKSQRSLFSLKNNKKPESQTWFLSSCIVGKKHRKYLFLKGSDDSLELVKAVSSPIHQWCKWIRPRHAKKGVLRQMLEAKVQISLCIHTSDQGLHCPIPWSLGTTECINGEQRPGWYFAHAQDDLNLH